MILNEAWATLGKDPELIFDQIKGQKNLDQKKIFVHGLLTKVKTIAKKLMAQSHPDKNPNDEDAVERFKRIQQASILIEQNLNEFIKKINKKQSQNTDDNSENCYIDFK